MDIKFSYKQLLENLYSSKGGLQLYTIHRRFNLKPSSVIDFINEYTSKGIISIIDESSIELTVKGRDNFRKIMSDLLEDEDSSGIGYLAKRLYVPMDKYSPYIPNDILRVEMSLRTTLAGSEFTDIPF